MFSLLIQYIDEGLCWHRKLTKTFTFKLIAMGNRSLAV